MIHLQSIALKASARRQRGFPFTLPLIANLETIELHHAVTFFVGENGSGKSTLLEAIAAGLNAVAVGGDDLAFDESLLPARRLGAHLRFTWQHKSHRGFFLRAEDFFNFARRLQAMQSELKDIADSFADEYNGEALGRAQGYVLAQRQALIDRYGENLDARSHGESFLKLFQTRFVPGGLYLLDEPEAPLSPQRQLSLLAMLKEMVAEGAQFIIATHSPLLMAYPEADILGFDHQSIAKVEYENVEHVSLTKAFLNYPQAYLRHL